MKEKDFFDIFNIAAKWRSLVGLIKDKGYKIPLVRKFFYVASLLYIIWPIDFIPEFILPVGLIDDIGVLAFFVMLLLYEIDKYEDYLAIGGTDEDVPGSGKAEKVDDRGETIDLDKKDWKEE